MKKIKLKELIIEEAKKKNLHFNQMLMAVAYERAITRLVQNKNLSDSVIFKGGVVMRVVYGSDRFTKDLDASYEKISEENLKAEVSKSLTMNLEDQFEFMIGTWSSITDEQDYEGLRYSVDFKFEGSTIQALQFDFTVSEFTGSGVKIALDSEIYAIDVTAKVYSPEMILAEKIQTVVARGSSNTRAKDFYDINLLLRGSIDDGRFKTLVDRVFKVRETRQPKSFSELSGLDTKNLENSWLGYKSKLNGLEFKDVWLEFVSNLETLDQKLSKSQ